MSEYQSGKIYKIYIEGKEDECYIGSTTYSLEERFHTHLLQSSQLYNGRPSASSALFKVIGSIPKIILLEAFPCNTKAELESREGYYQKQFPLRINKQLAGRSHKQWIEDNKEQQAEYKAQKRLANLEEAKKKDKEARERNKEAIAERRKEMVECVVCNKSITKHSLWSHNQTKAHLKKATQNPT